MLLTTMEALRSLIHKTLCEERWHLQFGFQTRYVMFESSVANRIICETNLRYPLYFISYDFAKNTNYTNTTNSTTISHPYKLKVPSTNISNISECIVLRWGFQDSTVKVERGILKCHQHLAISLLSLCESFLDVQRYNITIYYCRSKFRCQWMAFKTREVVKKISNSSHCNQYFKAETQ